MNKPLTRKETIALRKKYLGRSLSLSHKKHLMITRGYMQYLYDETGRRYLDAVNNVPLVGHSHPSVVKAVQEQAAVLNTNTRYLHENLVRYAKRLCDSLPNPLNVCIVVNSGSEANDLAIRMVKNFTGERDMVVIDGAYHGSLSSLIDISPYKFDGPGGRGQPEFTHKVIMPDLYQGPFRYGDEEAGGKYSKSVQESLLYIQKKGRNIAAFFGESLMGCGGQIVFPDDYLRNVYHHVRKAGGLCVADEVQIGFGRVGSCFWGFQTQDVVPDIVTVGKPAGNGFPLAAVITTEAIAGLFANGMEYFNTFGGNPVSCAAGLAVLDVLEKEALQEKSLKVGSYLKEGLNKMKDKFSIIGDVRGLGLFIGIELVRDKKSQAPFPEMAEYIVERMKEEGILIGADGPNHNVLKIKPPLVFSQDNADHLLETLGSILLDRNLPC